DLTRFAVRRCAGPDPQRRSRRRQFEDAILGWEFSPAGADCRYRAPLVPRLARRKRVYQAPLRRQFMAACWPLRMRIEPGKEARADPAQTREGRSAIVAPRWFGTIECRASLAAVSGESLV